MCVHRSVCVWVLPLLFFFFFNLFNWFRALQLQCALRMRTRALSSVLGCLMVCSYLLLSDIVHSLSHSHTNDEWFRRCAMNTNTDAAQFGIVFILSVCVSDHQNNGKQKKNMNKRFRLRGMSPRLGMWHIQIWRKVLLWRRALTHVNHNRLQNDESFPLFTFY